MTSYAIRPHYAKAIQWDGTDATAASIEQLIGTARFERPDPDAEAGDDGAAAGVLTDPHSSWREVYTGMWVIKRDDGQITVLSADRFDDTYAVIS